MKTKSLLRFVLMASVCLGFVGTSLMRAEEGTAASETKTVLPRLVDLGASKCIPCKMMKPILDKLTKEYAGRMDVVFIDVWENREEGGHYGIRVIPTQIFYDATGTERARHEGFMSEKDILAKWKELGVEFADSANQQTS
jgi:thioredoxin 1